MKVGTHKNTSYFILTGELWGVFYADFVKKSVIMASHHLFFTHNLNLLLKFKSRSSDHNKFCICHESMAVVTCDKILLPFQWQDSDINHEWKLLGVYSKVFCRNLTALLTLNMLNCFENYQRFIYISYHILDFVQQKETKFTTEQSSMLSILYCQYHACWCPGDLSRQGISKHGIDQISWNILSLALDELIAMHCFVAYLSLSVASSHYDKHASLWRSDGDLCRLPLTQTRIGVLPMLRHHQHNCDKKIQKSLYKLSNSYTSRTSVGNKIVDY